MPYTKYTKLPGSDRKPLPGATRTGDVDPNAIMQVTLTLRPRGGRRKQPSLDQLIASGQRLTREELASQYGADPKDVQKVGEFASAHGLAVARVDLATRSVALTGRTADFARAFQVELACYEHSGGTYRGRTGSIGLPSELSKMVLSVHGLDNRPQAKPHFRIADRANPAAAASVSYTALQVAGAYQFPTSVNGAGETIGIIELGGGFTTSDLSTYFSGLGISPAPTVTAVSVDGAQNQPTGDTSGPDTEVMLDIEVAGAVAPGANIVVYFAPNTDSGFLDAINQAVNDTVNKPSVVSISWGGPESTWTSQSLQSYNSALQAAAAVGVTFCVASGDNGSDDGVGDGADHVDFPASSPYSVACGGTTLTLSGTSISSEVVWNEQASGEGATGGGVSSTFAIPSWQSGISVPTASGFAGRGLPDVAGDADPTTGYQVQVDGSSFAVGGTSAVAPLWAGLIALINQSAGKAVGYLNPNLYQTIALENGTFNDITSGNNGDFSAGPGWDACTGWGSPDGTALTQAIGSASTPMPTTTPAPTPSTTLAQTTTTPAKRQKPPKRHPRRGAGQGSAKKKKVLPNAKHARVKRGKRAASKAASKKERKKR